MAARSWLFRFSQARWLRGGSAFWRNRQGAMAVMMALTMSVIVGFTAITLDGARYYNHRRRQQSATDFSALMAAQALTDPGTAAAASVQSNGFQAADVLSVEPGLFTPDPTLTDAKRFVPTTAGANGVRVTMLTQPPFIFGKALSAIVGPSQAATGTTGFSVRTRAIAVNQNTAAFGLATGVAQLDAGFLNSLLGPMLGLGGGLSLSLLDYQNLANTQIDLFSFSDALATKVGVTSSSYQDLLSASIQQTNVFSALQSVLSGTSAASSAGSLVSQLASRVGPISPLVLDNIIRLGPYGSRITGTTHPIALKTSALDLLTALARLNAQNGVTKANLLLNIPGIASVKLTMSLKEPATTSGFTGVGQQGSTLASAQTRLLLTLRLIGTGSASLVDLPIYLSLAQGTARLASVACAAGTSNASVSLGVTPGLVNAAIGTVSESAMADYSQAPAVQPAVLLDGSPLLQITGKAQATIANPSETLVNFAPADIQAATRKLSSTTNLLSGLTGSLIGNLDIKLVPLGLPIGLPSGLTQAVGQTISGATGGIDQVLNNVLSLLGLSVGNATTWVSGVRCGQSMLVH